MRAMFAQSRSHPSSRSRKLCGSLMVLIEWRTLMGNSKESCSLALSGC